MKPELVIENTSVSEESDCYVVAEIGHNHQGKMETARQLFRAAKDCGANAVKLQKRDNRTLYTAAMYNKPYDNENSFGATYGEHREALELNADQYRELQAYSKEIGITMFATAFDFRSADLLMKLNMPAIKIASGDLTNTPLLKHVAAYQKPMLVSSGGGTLDDVRRAYETILPINPRLCLMQCTAGYPCAFEEMNLRVITSFREQFPGAIPGLSAHDNGIAMSLVAYVMGARVIEKHFTLNRAMKGTDHAFSLEPVGLRKLVRDLRRARIAQGNGVKQSCESERLPLLKMAKKLVAARDLPAGHTLTREDIAIKSPSDGLPPYELENVLGRKTLRPLAADENITHDALASAPQAERVKTA